MGSESQFSMIIYSISDFPTQAVGSESKFSVVIYSISEFSDPGRGVGKLIFNCDLQHLGVVRPRPWGQKVDFQ